MGQDVPCPACACAEKTAVRAVEDHEYRVKRETLYASCAGCGSAFQEPMPSLKTLASFYPADYHSQTGQGFLSRARHGLRLARLKKWIRPGDVVLDYGCGNGSFLLAVSEALPEAVFFGYEVSDVRAIKKMRNGAVTIIEGGFDDLLRELPALRLITMNHVIEHLPDPGATLASLGAKLLSGGILEGQTPSAGSWEQAVFRSRWSGYHAPRHTVIFSPAGLGKCLGRSGFERIRISGGFNPASLAVSLASAVQKKGGGSRIVRGGPAWFFWLALAALLAPVDFLSGKPAIINFSALKK